MKHTLSEIAIILFFLCLIVTGILNAFFQNLSIAILCGISLFIIGFLFAALIKLIGKL